MAAYYARCAPEFERIYQKPERQPDLRRLQGQVERTFAGRRVLEAVCGTGYWTAILARTAVSVTAFDINEEMLAIARAKALAPDRVTWLRADAYALPAFPGRFDAGLAAFWWSHVPRKRLRPFLASFHAALSPGAVVMFMDNAWVEGESTVLSRTDEEGNTCQRRALADGSTHEVIKNYPTERELREAVAEAASDVKVEFLRYYWTLTYALKSRDGK
jgi:demethylmenaquinone methyltransferase/2-methoxy-6-polyprenyl-1,4-benzoquinol methylase